MASAYAFVRRSAAVRAQQVGGGGWPPTRPSRQVCRRGGRPWWSDRRRVRAGGGGLDAVLRSEVQSGWSCRRGRARRTSRWFGSAPSPRAAGSRPAVRTPPPTPGRCRGRRRPRRPLRARPAHEGLGRSLRAAHDSASSSTSWGRPTASTPGSRRAACRAAVGARVVGQLEPPEAAATRRLRGWRRARPAARRSRGCPRTAPPPAASAGAARRHVERAPASSSIRAIIGRSLWAACAAASSRGRWRATRRPRARAAA